MQIISNIVKFIVLSIVGIVLVTIGIFSMVVAYAMVVSILIVGFSMQIYRRVRYGRRQR